MFQYPAFRLIVESSYSVHAAAHDPDRQQLSRIELASSIPTTAS